MSREAHKAIMINDASKLEGILGLNPEIILNLLEIGFRCGMECKAGELQPIISGLDGIKVDLDDKFISMSN